MEYEKLFDTDPNDHLNFEDGVLKVNVFDPVLKNGRVMALTDKETEELYYRMMEYFES